jgi:hypothetical protein
MSSRTSSGVQTLLDAVVQSLTAALRTPDGVAPPVALLWTDGDGQWQPLIPQLAKVLPQLLCLGSYRPQERSGPVIWLRCVVDRALPDVLPADAVPVLYLPKVNRQGLRAGGDCPPELQPLIELQYRGGVWHQRNGRDWTVEAFLTSESGCGLDIALDIRTQDAMLRALPLLATEPLASLRGRRLEADDFDRLTIGDPIRDFLSWTSDPQGFESRCEPARWQTFRDVCRRELGLDPDAGGPQAAGDALLNGGPAGFTAKWDSVWRRFSEAPALYPGVAKRLREARPQGLFVDASRQPKENEAAEDKLRTALQDAALLPHVAACEKVLELEAQHAARRRWVWATLGASPLALALSPLSRLADVARRALAGSSAQALAEDYAAGGWRCDRAAMEAISSQVQAGDATLIGRVVRALYEPWLDRNARRFQELVATSDLRKMIVGVVAEKDTCVLFTDGLRFDIGALLHERLEARGLKSRLGFRFAPVPTVTATAKPMASPAYGLVVGLAGADDFNPVLTNDGKPITAQRLRDAMSRQGVEILDSIELRFAGSTQAGGWSEIGRLDELGHSMGARLVSQIEVEVETIAERIVGLLNSGWQRVRVVTDHGWLLLPGSLPKLDLPAYLVGSRWARCATVRGQSATTMPTYPWHWNDQVRIASPPGIGSFTSNAEYAHGGVSPQESVIPDLVVERGLVAVSAKLTSLTWRGMRCKAAVAPMAGGLRVDLRLNWKQADSSIAVAAKDVSATGEASLACADDRHEGGAAMVVLLDSGGQVLDYKPTTVGESS